MCTETFLHLPEEKKHRFLEAAWEEFTTVSFASASINQIIRRAGIPRGSFYQYFSDKSDLFFYLMNLIGAHFSEELRKTVLQTGGNLFRTLLLCFDRLVQKGPAADYMFDRCLRIIQLNPEIFFQITLSSRPDHCFLEAAWTQVDLSAFRSRDPDYVYQVFLLALLALAAAVRDTLAKPENSELHRRALVQRLTIIHSGGLAERDSTKEVPYA